MSARMILAGAMYTPYGTALVIVQALSICALRRLTSEPVFLHTVAQARILAAFRGQGERSTAGEVWKTASVVRLGSNLKASGVVAPGVFAFSYLFRYTSPIKLCTLR